MNTDMKRFSLKPTSELYKRIVSGIVMLITTVFCILAGDIINIVFFSFCFMCAISEWYNIALKIFRIRKKMWIFYEEKNFETTPNIDEFSNSYSLKFIIILALGVVYIFLGFYNLFILSIFKWPAFFILSISSITDIFAYLGGKYFEGKKLCPKISPGKTISGLLCGITAAGIFSILTRNNANIIEVSIAFCQGFLLGIISQLGDLLESYTKRKANLKNSGNLIPGHGGILDRIDGILGVSFVLSIYFIFFN